MAEQVCPHCDRVITKEDLTNYPTKLEERRLRKEYFSSGIYRKHNRIFNILVFLGIIGVFLPVILLMASDKFSEYMATLLGLEIVAGLFTVLWVVYSTWQNIRLQNKYIKSRLEANNQ